MVPILTSTSLVQGCPNRTPRSGFSEVFLEVAVDVSSDELTALPSTSEPWAGATVGGCLGHRPSQIAWRNEAFEIWMFHDVSLILVFFPWFF